MITVVSRDNDFVRKIQKVVLQDKYGSKHVINHPLAKPGYDAAAMEASVMAQMESVCDAFEAATEPKA